MYFEDDLLPISGLQHLAFCPRQCALIHVEGVWAENRLTAEGRVMHQRVDERAHETRGDVRREYGLRIRSLALGLFGVADTVEFHRQADGWHPFPVEHKRGKSKGTNPCDRVQLCAQAVCLEEMCRCAIPAGALFYGETRDREEVAFDFALRAQTAELAQRFHALVAGGLTPAPVHGPPCKACSLLADCRPRTIASRRSARAYLQRVLEYDGAQPLDARHSGRLVRLASSVFCPLQERIPAMSASPIGPSGGYRRMLSFGFTCLVYHATTRFCKRVYPWKDDPLGKTSGQMIGAARSARQNLVEASSRAGTSKETELRLLDVAKGSLEELLGDYEAYLIDNDQPVWSVADERWKSVHSLPLDEFSATEDVPNAFSRHIIAMRARFAPWIEHENPLAAANATIVVIKRAESLLFRQMEKTAAVFCEEGGFRERMTRLRMEQREALQATKPPPPFCPGCGKPMTLRKARTGPSAGKAFWGCSGYPACKAIQEVVEGDARLSTPDSRVAPERRAPSVERPPRAPENP